MRGPTACLHIDAGNEWWVSNFLIVNKCLSGTNLNSNSAGIVCACKCACGFLLGIWLSTGKYLKSLGICMHIISSNSYMWTQIGCTTTKKPLLSLPLNCTTHISDFSLNCNSYWYSFMVLHWSYAFVN